MNQESPLDMAKSRPPPFAILAYDAVTEPEMETETGSISCFALNTRIKDDSDPNYYGPLDTNLNSIVQRFGDIIASNIDPEADESTTTKITTTLLKFIALAKSDCELLAQPQDKEEITKACWLTVRMTLPTEEWQVPRWHQDGLMFKCSCHRADREDIWTEIARRSGRKWMAARKSAQGEENQSERRPDAGEEDPSDAATPPTPHSKYATVLLGPPTRLLKPSEIVKAEMTRRPERPRKELTTALKECEEEDVAGAGKGAVVRFSWGEEDSPCHSEPDCTDHHRIFTSILFGSEEEIKFMTRMRKEVYGVIRTRTPGDN